jgi:EAL domain-containing protein (putative c-di-GMP-specific phosphodiesterase class I)
VLEPEKFIPALESSGLIIAVGRWVLDEACRQANLWRGQGHNTNMSVNVSARQLDAGCLLDDVRAVLSQSEIPPESLTIEITETCLMRDTTSALRQLTALKTLGVRIAIDDFGTGYSSLAYLQQFPVDAIKIDRTFVSAMAKSPEGDALLHTLIQLGKALNLETVAEGIEQTGQLNQLQAEQCETGQGYLVARPLPPNEAARFFPPVHLPAETRLH